MTIKRLFLSALLLVALAAAGQVGDVPRSTPAEQGIDPQAVAEFFEALQAVPQTDIHHVIVARHGHVVAELHPAPFAATDAHTLYSESKTFTSMAVGIAVGENRLRLTDRAAAYFPDRLPATVTPRLAQITVRDLLLMSSGITPDWEMRNHTDDWVATWLAKPVEAEPGTRFQYDSMCTFLLSAIVQRATGQTLLDYLRERLFEPMHITEVDWEQSPDGITTGGWGLHLQAESQLKLGLLLLAGGQWQGRQLVPEQWVAEAITPQADLHPDQARTDGNSGYGYQIWGCRHPGAFRADGAYGQYVVCVPDADLVVVINQASNRGHDVLACIWDCLMQGVHTGPLPADAAAQSRLERLAARATVPAVRYNDRRRAPEGAFALGENPLGLITVEQRADTLVLAYTDGHVEHLPVAPGRWQRSALAGLPPYSVLARNRFGGLRRPFAVAARAGWTARGVWDIDLQYVDWITAVHLSLDQRAGTATITNTCDRANPRTVTATRLR